jgi:hypothetical protein
MDRVAEYLRVPAGYARALGGLRWSTDADVLERADGAAFAFAAEVVAFLEGFALSRPFVHFGHVLHLLHLLKAEQGPRGRLGSLRPAFVAAGRSLRKAGAFAGALCRGLPAAPEAPSAYDVWQWSVFRSFSTHPTVLTVTLPGEEPPLAPADFEARLARALAAYEPDEIRHWLEHGQGPDADAAGRLADALRRRPRSLAGALAELQGRRRLADAAPLVPQLAGALTLPPRRLDELELPVGGYADVTTSGHPERLLISQLALDGPELVRRFAENELLFFRREGPRQRAREELVVLLDQGVRTWGPVRLVLAAALFAFGRLAGGRKLPFRVATTSNGGRPLDPLEEDDDALAALVEASDLSEAPALALERLLEEPTAAMRDVVLLTHPRALAAPDVAVAARRLRPPARLFALAVEDDGASVLAEVRHGGLVELSRFRVDLEARPAATPAATAPRAAGAAWDGDVEPVPFPFRFGAGGRVTAYDFDHAGEWLLAATDEGTLHLMRTDGSAYEVLPRPWSAERDQVMSCVAVVGVTGGFVLGVTLADELMAAHYDLSARTCRVAELGQKGQATWRWWYVRELHSVIVSRDEETRAVDLATYATHLDGKAAARAAQAVGQAKDRPPPRAPLPVTHDIDTRPPNGVHLTTASGLVEAVLPGRAACSFTPTEDGRPALAGSRVAGATAAGPTLALLVGEGAATGRAAHGRLRLFRLPDGLPLGTLDGCPDPRLSEDGRLVAVSPTHDRLVVRQATPGLRLVASLPRGGYHSNAVLSLGSDSLLIRTEKVAHLAVWSGGGLEHRAFSGPELTRAGAGLVLFQAQSGHLPDGASYDPRRFRASVKRQHRGPVAVLDAFGQVALLDNSARLLAMFFAFQNRFAAWMPDGTRFGDPELLGGPPTPGAAQAIARALRAVGRADS